MLKKNSREIIHPTTHQHSAQTWYQVKNLISGNYVTSNSSCHATNTDFRLSFVCCPSLPSGPPDYILCLYRAVVDMFYLLIDVKGSLMSSPLFLQQCCAYLVCLIWMVLEMGGSWLYSCCFLGCCFQELFNIVCSLLMQLPSRFFSLCVISVHVMHPYSSMDMTDAWKKKLGFILSDKSDFHMTNNLLIV